MSDTDETFGLVDRSVFDRVASSLNGWMKIGSVEFRFVRGGTFRASVVKEKLPATLTSIQVDNATFDSALSEVVIFLNSFVFDLPIKTLTAQLTLPGRRPDFSDEARSEFQEEIKSRLNYIKESVSVDKLKSRAYARLHAPCLTFDSVSWSMTRGTLFDSEDKAIDVSSVGVMLSFFRPGFAQPNGNPFSFNFLDLGNPQTEKFSVCFDEVDIIDLISELEKMKTALQTKGKK